MKFNSQTPPPFQQMIRVFSFLTGMENEADLDMDLAVVPDVYPLPRIDNFDSFIRLHQGSTRLPRIVMSVQYSAFKKLYLLASANYVAADKDKCVTALRIVLGLKNNSIVPLFQATYYRLDSGTKYNCVYESDKHIYNHSTQEFDKYTGTFDYISEYRQNIGIRHNGVPEFENYIPTVGGIIGDNDAVIFPFQTIYTLMYESDQDSYVQITNALATDLNPDLSKVQLLCKHSLLLSANQSIFGIMKSLKNNYANRSHLCPPGCSSINDFDLI